MHDLSSSTIQCVLMYRKDMQNTAVLVALPVMIAVAWKKEGHVE